jgi:hypothetical protein
MDKITPENRTSFFFPLPFRLKPTRPSEARQEDGSWDWTQAREVNPRWLAGNVLGSEGTHAHTTEAFPPFGRWRLPRPFSVRCVSRKRTWSQTPEGGSSDRPNCPSVWCCSSNICPADSSKVIGDRSGPALIDTTTVLDPADSSGKVAPS